MKKTAIVTGAASGIGHTIATNLAKIGFHVTAIDRHHAYFLNGITSHQIELRDYHTLSNVINRIPYLNVAINCAGMPCERKSLINFTEQELVEQWQENVVITFNALKLEIIKMQAQKTGKIINIASSTAHRGMKNMLAYSSAKASIIVMTKIAAIENAEYNIQINSISPATIDTPMIRKKYNGKKRDYSYRYYTGDCGSTQDVYTAVRMFIDNNFLTGHDLVIDGGLSDLCEI